MTAMRELLHLAAKDARRVKWYLLAYGALLVLLALDEILAVTAFPMISALLKLGPVGVALLIVVIVVQEDSPIRAESYWMSKPISPVRMAIAKLVLLGLTLIVSAVLVELLLVARFGLLREGAAASMLLAAIVFALYLSGMAAIGANTRTVQSAAIAAVAIVVAVMITILMVRWSYTIMTPLMQQVLIVAGGVGSLVSFIWLYAQRDNRVPPALLAAASIYAAALGMTLDEISGQHPESVPLLIGKAPFVMDSVSGIGELTFRLTDMHFSADSQRPERFILAAMHLDLAGPGYRDGWEFNTNATRRLTYGDPQLIRGTTWLNTDSLPSGMFRLPDGYEFKEDLKKPTAGDTLTYEGRVDQLMPRIVFETPVEQTSDVAVERSLVRIRTFVDESPRHVVEMQARSLGSTLQKTLPLITGSEVSYVLFNDVRSEALFLQPQMTHVQSRPIITPWLTRGEYTYRLAIDSATYSRMSDPKAWVRESKLAVVAWERVASWPVKLVHIMP